VDATGYEYEPPPAPRVADDGVLTYANAVVAAIRGYRPLHLDLRVPPGPGPAPLVVWIHGGGWCEGSRLRLPETMAEVGFHDRLLRRGYAVADVDYRLSREATFPAQLHDVTAAIRWLRGYAADLRLDPGRFAAWGESAGGHLAALAGLTAGTTNRALAGEGGLPGVSSAVQAVVDWYGVAGLIEEGSGQAMVHSHEPAEWLLGGSPFHERRAEAMEASPVNQVHPGAPPFLLMHGTADKVVPYRHSELLAAALRERGVRGDLYPVPDADHIFRGAPDVGALVEASLDFLDEVLLQAA
jgi:acetyl esterase/lipase